MIREVSKLSMLNFVLLPIFLAFIYGFAYRFRNRHYGRSHPWRKYFIPALTVKIFGAIFIGLIYSYYYHGGDTFNYFYHSQVINSAMDESFFKWLKLLLHIPSANDGNYQQYISHMIWYNAIANYTVSSIVAFLGVFTLNTYLPTAVLFAVISFTGIWALFRTFASLYPKQLRSVAIAVLFIPSVAVWGSGIFKDTICIFALGWLTYSSFRFLVKKDFTFKNIAFTIMSFLLIYTIKVYIVMAFTPALLMWIFFNYSSRLKNKSQKLLASLVLLIAVAGSSFFFLQRFSDELGRYSLENIVATSQSTSWYISRVTDDEGSAYSLGNFSPSIAGMLAKFPAAVNVTLFRPYPWESKKVIVLLSALEALLFLFITLKIIISVGFRKIWSTISSDPTIQFCLIFTAIFAFAVGISSYNFGALSRYKIPCMPFYALALFLIYYKNKPEKSRLIKFLNV